MQVDNVRWYGGDLNVGAITRHRAPQQILASSFTRFHYLEIAKYAMQWSGWVDTCHFPLVLNVISVV
jgi:hypothetical protein